MTMVEFLKTEPNINLKEVAKLMWPNNKRSNVYLSMKLSGARPWTTTDTELAKKALDKIYTGFTEKYRNLT